MFCAPSPIGEPARALSTAWRKIDGGQTATRTSTAWPTPTLTASASSRAASAVCGFIFQLPAMNRDRLISEALLRVRDGRNPPPERLGRHQTATPSQASIVL